MLCFQGADCQRCQRGNETKLYWKKLKTLKNLFKNYLESAGNYRNFDVGVVECFAVRQLVNGTQDQSHHGRCRRARDLEAHR